MMKKSLLPQAPFRRFLRVMSLILILAVMLSTSLVANSITVSISNALKEQTFTLYPEDGVTVTLSGNMPLNGSAEAKPADCDGEDVLHAYDITIRYADGREFEPESGSPIDVSFKSDRIALAVGRENELTAEHISDSGETEEVPLTVCGSSEASFTADSFSVYRIKKHESDSDVETPRKTFMFLSNQFDEYEHTGDDNNPQAGYYVSGLYQFPNKDNEKVCFQIVKDQEKLQPVVIPPNFDWGHFYGWFIVQLDLEKSKQATAAATGRDVSEITEDTLTRYVYKWSEEPVQMDSVTPISVAQDETVYLAPLYSNYRFVTFHEHDHTDDGQPCNIIMRKIIVLGSNGQCEVDISDVVADSPDPQNYVFYGWKFKNTAYQTRLSTGDVVHQTITVTEEDIQQQTGQGDDDEVYSVDVYPIFKEARWITFVHGEAGWNAKYVPAMFSFLYDTSVPEAQRVSISQLPSTTRPGYIFDGWYTGRMETGGDGADHIVYDQKVTTPATYYTFTYRYNPTTARNQNNMYGVVDNEYVLLSSSRETVWMPQYVYTPVDKSTYAADGYVLENGEYVTVYYKSGTWYRSRSWSWFSYEYSDPVAADATIYSAAEGTEPYDGTRYKRSGNTYTVATNNSGTQYMVDDRGGHVPLTRPTIYLYTYNGVSYTGQRYTRTTNTDYSTEYRSTRYKKVNGAMVALGEDESYSGTIYGIDENLYYAQIELRSQTVITWRINNGEKYTGPRYTLSSKSGSMLTWTGLYGQTFAQNSYSWDTVRAYAWTGVGADGKSSTQTLLDGFSEAKNPYDLEQGESTGSNIIYHYKQKVDGTYDNDNRYQANYSSNYTTFNFTNKFDGFTVAGYSGTFNANFDREHLGAGEHAVEQTGSTATLTGNTIHIYHTRNAFELTLANFRTTNNSPNEPNDKVIPGIKYEQCLNTIAEADRTPPPRENYTFEGWYYDKAFTKKVDFNTATMPDGNLILYAKWVYKYYFVEIDPNGGVIEDALEFSAYTGFDSPRKQSTYTWVQFGGKIGAYDNVERHYIPDPNGEYCYVNVKFAETFAEAAAKSWDYSIPAQYRAAFYCKATDLETVYNEHFSDRLDHDFFMNYCVDQTQLYRRCSGKEGFTLAAWYKVNDDGTTSHDIYNFGDTVTKPTRIRAVWRKSGEYTIEYNPYMRRYAVGGYVEHDGVMHHNETHIDPSEGTKYTDEATATIYTHPKYIPDGYIFRGWQLLDSRLHETGQYYNPSSEFTIDSSYADNNGVIHFEAAYEPDKESVRRVDTVSLVLDANTVTGGYVVKNGLDVYEDYAYVDLTQNQVLLKKQPNNVAVNLHDYYNNFHNSHGYMLIGWNETPTAEHFIPKYPADAVIGVDSKNMPATNKLYAIWEPMYYLTLENHSTEYDVSFNLKFTDYNGVVYSNDTNDVVSVFEREVFSNHNADNLTVTKKGDGDFDVTLKAGTADAPNGVKLVLPQGDQASYTVTGDIQGKPIYTDNNGKSLTVFNSGGANDTANRTKPQFSVTGSMIHSEEGQTVAFYTEDLPHTKISLKACYYDPTTGTWQPDDDASDSTGPNPTLSFPAAELPAGITPDADNSITLDIMQQNNKTFSIEEAFANTAQYKFIGWFSKDSAAPRDRSIDNREFGAAKVTGLTATNDPEKNYYALYVPYSDGTLTLSHDESQTSIGYPKKLSIEASYGSNNRSDEVTTHIEVEDSITHVKVHTGITFANFQEPRTTEEAQTAFNIKLNAMSGYGCVHYNTYEEGRPLGGRISDESTVINVYIDPDVTDETPHDGVPVETKHYYRYELNRTVGDMFTDSETVKGYKTIKNIRFYSDFERKYEFVYNYIFRDGTTVRKYQVKDATAYLKSDSDFKQFVFESAPYISNFGEDFVWQPSSITVSNLYGKGQVTATMDAVQTKSATAHVIVKRFDASIPWAIDVGTAFPKGKRPTADLIINGQQFKRWKVEDTNTEKLIGYCYSPEFSFVVWGDYTITPEYVPMTGDEYQYIAPTDENDCYVTLDYLDSTRNQWVGLDENNNIIVDAKGVATQHYDSLISDFSMVFVDQGKRINADADNYRLGLILEVVGKIENTNIPDQYTVTPSDDATKTRALNAIINSNRTSGYLNNPDGTVKFYFSKIDPSKLSDANRIEFYRGIDNLLGTNGELNPNAKNVFHAYAYMKLPDGTIKLSDPVTLQMYNLAVRTVTG